VAAFQTLAVSADPPIRRLLSGERPQGEHWVGGCFCATSQVHIVHFDPSAYDTFALIAPQVCAALPHLTARVVVVMVLILEQG
jgi:hypothetical protein